MAERTITAFEAAPQGQIGSGLAQVFDTTNLVQAAVAMKQQRQAQYTQLVESLADIDPNLARPQDTPAILAEFNDLYNYVVENYEDISNPMRNPEAAIKMKQKKNELLRAVNASKALGEYQLKLAEEMPKNDYFMDMYGKNSELIERINSSTVYTTDADGKRVFNPQAVSLLSEGLQIGKDPNTFAIELADEMKPQFDGNISYTTVGGVKLFQSTPMTLTEDDLNKVIDASLTGKTANSVAVTNSILGVEVPYDTLTDAEKDRVRNALRPLLSQRLDTKGEWKIYTPPSNFGEQKREFDIDTRNRSLESILTVKPEGIGLVSGLKWGQFDGTVTNAVGEVDDNGELVFTVSLQDGNKVSTQRYVYGKQVGNELLIGDEAGSKYDAEFNKLLNAANVTINATQGGDVKTPDLERINESFKQYFKERVRGGLDVNISSGTRYNVGGEAMTLPQVQSVVRGVVKANNTSKGRVNALKRLMQEANFAGGIELTASENDNKVILKVGNQSTDYDLDNEQQLKAFVDVVLRQTAVPSTEAGESKRMRVGTVTPFDAANDPVLGSPQQ